MNVLIRAMVRIRMKIFLPLHESKHSLFVLYDTEMDVICFK